MSRNTTYEIIFYGRGGQGAITAAQLVAQAAISRGLYALTNPEFGPERRGAPVKAYLKISTDFVDVREPIESPNISVVLGPDLLRVNPEIIENTRDYIVINSRKYESISPYLEKFHGSVVHINAYDLAIRYLGKAIVNTAMIGALLKVFDAIDINDITRSIGKVFSGKLAKVNFEIIKEAYNVARVVK